ncbi:MAG: site-specific DNA-methyltransferase, partial [Curtobacterium sp.]
MHDDRGPDRVVHGDALDVLTTLDDGSFTLVYLDPPFNTGRKQRRHASTAVRSADDAASAPGRRETVTGFRGGTYER